MQTKQCVHCRAQINIAAKVCPFCRQKQNKSPLPWVIIGIILFIIVVGGIASSSDEPKSVDDSNSSVSSEKKSNESKKDFEQNEIVEYRDVKYQVVKVQKSQGSTWEKPNNGKEYIIVTLKIENGSNGKIDYNEYDWKMTDSNGNEEDPCFTTIDSNTSLSSGNLDVGGKIQGTVVFEKPKGDTGLRLRYYDSYFDDNYKFQISIK